MISASEARRRITELGRRRPLEWEWTSLEEMTGRILAEDLFSGEPVPAWDNSAMDGFAVRAADVALASSANPVSLRVVASFAAGDEAVVREQDLGARETAVEIMTGAPMPAGPWDSVLKVEDVEVRSLEGGAREVLLRAPVDAGAFVRRKGEDFDIGTRVAAQGTEVSPDLLLALAGLGIVRARTLRKPRVAILSTGRELVPADTERLAPGMIRNSTAPYLMAALARLGVEAKGWGTIADSPEEFAERMKQVLADRPDVIITTGAVSMGRHDFVRASLEALGARTLFHKMAIRPGKPLLFCGFEGGPVVFGIPGNPISTAVGLRFFVEPYLRAMRGLEAERPVRARLAKSVRKPDGLRCYFKAEVAIDERGVTVEALAGQGSALVGPLVRSNAWVELSEVGAEVCAGEWVDVHPLFPFEKSWSAAVREHESAALATARVERHVASSDGECCR